MNRGITMAMAVGIGLNAAGAAAEPASFPLPAESRAVEVSGVLGRLDTPWVLALAGPDGKTGATLTLVASDPMEGCMDVTLAMPGRPAFKQRYFTRPDLKFYPDDARKNAFLFRLADKSAFDERSQVADKYHLFRSVLAHPFAIRLEHDASEGIALWLDGRFLVRLPDGLNAASGTVKSAEGVPPVSLKEVQTGSAGNFLALDLVPYHRPGTLAFTAQPSNFPPGEASTGRDVPMRVDAVRGAIDVGLGRWLEEKIDPADFCDTDTTRSAFDGNPESIILRVPKANYRAAHLLCVVEPDPARTPVLTLRLTRFGNHYGDSGGRTDQAIADTTVYLPTNAADPLPEGVVRAGDASVSLLKKGRWAAAREKATLPLYRVTVPLQTGKVADLLGEDAPPFGRDSGHWDLELTREIRTAVQFLNLQSCRIKPLGLPSSVHVIGLTLERSPVDVVVSAKEKGNVFEADPDPAFDLALTNREAAPVAVEVVCEATAYDGSRRRVAATVKVPGRGGGTATALLPLDMGGKLGYFDAVITARLPDGREVWREPTSFALLPPDTRTAGDESPFGVWWFVSTHGGCSRLDWMGPLLMKMGVRHVCPGPFSGEELKPYKLSYSMASWPLKKREELLKKNPGIRLGMIFHEKSVPDTDAIPPELLGKPAPELTEAGKAAMDKYWKEAGDTVAWYRSNYPAIRLSLGNSPSGISLWFMRKGWPKDRVGCFAMEGVGAWMTPEGQPRRGALQEVWFLSELRKIYGYGDVPVSSGYEYITRCSQPGALTEREQGEYHVRDALHCLAYGYPSINIGLADDCADSYYSTIYGGSGFLRRNPLLTPKPGYVMYATMTRLLDKATYNRWLDTGSRSLYALEFRKGDGYVYPVWTVTGRRTLSFRLSRGRASAVDSMGNPVALAVRNGIATLEATTAPVYLQASAPVKAARAGAPAYEERPPEAAVTVSRLETAGDWTISQNRDEFLETFADDQLYAAGAFEVREAADGEKGPCLELELKPQPEVPALAARYVSLTLKQPVTMEGEAGRIGLWVKGNSCWGRVFWEFEDAKGERYFSAASEGAGWDVSDWRSRSAIAFDGWKFVSLPLPKRYPGGYHGPTDHDWSYHGGDGDGVVQHPITVKRLVVALRDSQVYVTERVPSIGRSIRVKDLVVGL